MLPRKIGGAGLTRYIDVARAIYCDSICQIFKVSPQVRAVDQHRINDEWEAGIIAGHRKAYLVGINQDIVTLHDMPDPLYLLVDNRFLLTEGNTSQVQ